MAERPPGPETESDDRTVGELVLDVSEQASGLIREEIELAKTEISEKVTKILQGSVVGILAGVFVLMSLAMLMHGIAWLLNDLFFETDVWLGFIVEAVFWLLVAVVAGWAAWRSLRSGSPPTPDMAIEEAKRAKEAFDETPEEPGGKLASELAGQERDGGS